MVEHYQSRPGVLEADPGLSSILDLLQSEFAIIQELALKTLHSCMHNGKLYIVRLLNFVKIYNCNHYLYVLKYVEYCI